MSSTVARRLRANQTDAERRLRSRLRNKELECARFRRRVPIGKYVVDFYSHAARLITEIAGGPHSDRQAQDAARAQDIERPRFPVVRFWINDITENIDGVLERIRAYLIKI